MSDKKVFAGSGKKQNDTWLKITINPDKIQDYIQEYNGNKFVKLNVNILKEADKFGKDVKITVDTWEKPQTKQVDKDLDQALRRDDDGSDLPF